MTSINEITIKNLELNNYKSVYIEGIRILLKLLDNIVKEPENVKYRKIKTSNNVIKQKLMVLNEIDKALCEIGYKKDNDGDYVLSSTVLIATVKKYRDYINQRLAYVITVPEIERSTTEKDNEKIDTLKDIPRPTTSGAISKPLPPTKKVVRIPSTIPGKPYLDKIRFPKVLQTPNSHLRFIENISDSFFQYEDKQLQKYTLKYIIPVETLKQNSIEKMRKIQRMIRKENLDIEEPIYDEVFLIEVLNWFNTSFFKWADNVQCRICRRETKAQGSTEINGVRVETINCCGTQSGLYRYNDVAILLCTRKGRCGEYANCFTFICRCLGYDARYVYADFDHVWTEVYSPFKKQWIHFDPSENASNTPLVYEHGWKRNITYVIAVSIDDVQDVTWRYTSFYDKVLERRTKFSESELLDAIFKIREKRQQNVSVARKSFLKKRNLAELASFMTARTPNDQENAGRNSGSLDWRLLRGENNINDGYVFELNDSEIRLKEFAVRYSCAKDVYEKYNRTTNDVLERKAKWQTCLYGCENIFYKKEQDWKMVYLCRTQNSEFGRLEWQFDFTKSKMRIKDIYVKLNTKTYENGKIDVWFVHENGTKYKSTADLKDSSKFSIIAELSLGKGDCGWQHAQLFREEFNSTDYPFEVTIKFH